MTTTTRTDRASGRRYELQSHWYDGTVHNYEAEVSVESEIIAYGWANSDLGARRLALRAACAAHWMPMRMREKD